MSEGTHEDLVFKRRSVYTASTGAVLLLFLFSFAGEERDTHDFDGSGKGRMGGRPVEEREREEPSVGKRSSTFKKRLNGGRWVGDTKREEGSFCGLLSL